MSNFFILSRNYQIWIDFVHEVWTSWLFLSGILRSWNFQIVSKLCCFSSFIVNLVTLVRQPTAIVLEDALFISWLKMSKLTCSLQCYLCTKKLRTFRALQKHFEHHHIENEINRRRLEYTRSDNKEANYQH